LADNLLNHQIQRQRQIEVGADRGVNGAQRGQMLQVALGLLVQGKPWMALAAISAMALSTRASLR